MPSVCLLGTWNGINQADEDRVRHFIASNGGWANWWSFPIREDFAVDLSEPFYLYLNAGGQRITHRMWITEHRSSRGNDGLISPWPEKTDPELRGKARIGPKTSEVFKTWLIASRIERLDPPLSLSDFDPARNTKREALLNQASFGYAHRKSTSAMDREELQRASIREALKEILELYPSARNEPFGNRNPITRSFNNLAIAVRSNRAVANGTSIKVERSIGMGNWARVPWVAVLDRRVTGTTQAGYYVVYLFRQDMSGVYLTLNQGVTNSSNAELRERAVELRQQSQRLGNVGFLLDNEIDLRVDRGLGAKYEVSTVAYKLYELDQLPDEPVLQADLEEILGVYQEVVAHEGEPNPAKDQLSNRETEEEVDDDVEGDFSAIVRSFTEALTNAGLTFGARHTEIISSFMCALATKPLVILTGLSGSGKTQVAVRLGQWLGEKQYLVVPVRPDWTGPEALFGYEDALRSAGDRPAWHVPHALEFILHAARDASRPYLLILDEMNLAHVERYFADALSGMETTHGCLPNLARNSAGLWYQDLGSTRSLPFPRNLFIVGTVNVDETTYMFSPKVLDRANTFEFRVGTESLLSAVRRPANLVQAPLRFSEGFLKLARDDQWHNRNQPGWSEEFHGMLKTLHSLLAEHSMEFGHRVYYEANRFASFLASCGAITPEEVLDRQVLQKVLPRIHGSRKRVEGVLFDLGEYCVDPATNARSRLDSLSGPASRNVFDVDHPDVRLPHSFDKLARMMKILKANQFVSFTD